MTTPTLRAARIGGMRFSPALPRSLPAIGKACQDLRLHDAGRTWRIVYHVDATAIAILEVFAKTTQQTRKAVIDTCKARLRLYTSI